MDNVAQVPMQELNALFANTAEQMGVAVAVVEKDFWVCWTLKHLFSDPQLKNHIIFKREISLSKAYGLINRFSEDIDLILDWRMMGYGDDEKDPYQEFTSANQQKNFFRKMKNDAKAYIAGELKGHVSTVLGRELNKPLGFKVTTNEPCIYMEYPKSSSDPYIRPEILLETILLSAWSPSEVVQVNKSAGLYRFPYFDTSAYQQLLKHRHNSHTHHCKQDRLKHSL